MTSCLYIGHLGFAGGVVVGVGLYLHILPPLLIFEFSKEVRERCKKKEKKLTNVSFAFTHTYTPVKTNMFPFFPQAYMENFEKCAKTQKQKNNMLSHVTCGC